MDDWRYETLKADVRELRKEISELRRRSSTMETWQYLLPLRLVIGVSWLAIIGIVVARSAQ